MSQTFTVLTGGSSTASVSAAEASFNIRASASGASSGASSAYATSTSQSGPDGAIGDHSRKRKSKSPTQQTSSSSLDSAGTAQQVGQVEQDNAVGEAVPRNPPGLLPRVGELPPPRKARRHKYRPKFKPPISELSRIPLDKADIEYGKVYLIQHVPKTWDGRQWRRVCLAEFCARYAVATGFCKAHGGGNRCTKMSVQVVDGVATSVKCTKRYVYLCVLCIYYVLNMRVWMYVCACVIVCLTAISAVSAQQTISSPSATL
jgi:hypothetical protein